MTVFGEVMNSKVICPPGPSDRFKYENKNLSPTLTVFSRRVGWVPVSPPHLGTEVLTYFSLMQWIPRNPENQVIPYSLHPPNALAPPAAYLPPGVIIWKIISYLYLMLILLYFERILPTRSPLWSLKTWEGNKTQSVIRYGGVFHTLVSTTWLSPQRCEHGEGSTAVL